MRWYFSGSKGILELPWTQSDLFCTTPKLWRGTHCHLWIGTLRDISTEIPWEVSLIQTTRRIVFGTKLLSACDLFIGEADSSIARACPHSMWPILRAFWSIRSTWSLSSTDSLTFQNRAISLNLVGDLLHRANKVADTQIQRQKHKWQTHLHTTCFSAGRMYVHTTSRSSTSSQTRQESWKDIDRCCHNHSRTVRYCYLFYKTSSWRKKIRPTSFVPGTLFQIRY